MSHDFFVGESYDPASGLLQEALAKGILFLLRIMYRPVDFNDQPGGCAVEVDDERSDNVLPAELRTAEVVSTQHLPEPIFLRCGLAPLLENQRLQLRPKLRRRSPSRIVVVVHQRSLPLSIAMERGRGEVAPALVVHFRSV